jgi:hypothetical protein
MTKIGNEGGPCFTARGTLPNPSSADFTNVVLFQTSQGEKGVSLRSSTSVVIWTALRRNIGCPGATRTLFKSLLVYCPIY